LDREPENEEALKYFFNLHKYNQAKSEKYYAKLMQLLIKEDFDKAIELFNEHFPNLTNSLAGDILLKLGLYFYNNADLAKARLCLELASEQEGSWQPKAMITLGQTFEGLGNEQYAKSIYNNIISRFTDTVFHQEAKARLAHIQ
jgi:TolA-binding protein